MGEKAGLQIIAGGDRQPMAGVTFTMKGIQLDPPGNAKRFLTFDALATIAGVECGLAVDILLTGWEKELANGDLPVYRGDLRLRSIPYATEHFATYLERAFELPIQSPDVFGKLFCDCAAFLNSPETIETNEFVGRVFFGDGSPPESDVSVFMIINLSEKRAWFSEKDGAYRKGLIDWFRGKYT